MTAEIAEKGAKKAVTALTGDLYVRRTTKYKTKGKGKKKQVVPVESELHINPLTLLLGLGAGALALGGAMWATQTRLGPTKVTAAERIAIEQFQAAHGELPERKVSTVDHYDKDGRPVYITRIYPAMPAQGEIWGTSRFGRQYRGGSPDEVFRAAFPEKHMDTYTQSDSIYQGRGYRIYSKTVTKKKMSIEKRQGFFGSYTGKDEPDDTGKGDSSSLLDDFNMFNPFYFKGK